MYRNARTVVRDGDDHHVGEGIGNSSSHVSGAAGLVLQGLLRIDDQVEQNLVKLVMPARMSEIGEIQRHVDVAGCERRIR